VHTANGKVGFSHLLSEPVDFSPRVAENDGLCDCQSTISDFRSRVDQRTYVS
jgi:hypothetical protein